MKKIAYPSLLTLLLLNIADICNLHAATFYVATNHTVASDANTGTSTEPLKTIAAGVNKLFAGDTLVVQEGIYRESITITRSGTENQPIVIMAEPVGSVTIRGSQLVTNWTKLESSNIYVHDNWPFYFGRWNATLKNGDLQAQFTNEMSNDTSTSFALNQIFVDTNLIMEVARLENMVEGSFYIDPSAQRIYLWLSDQADPNSKKIEVTNQPVLLKCISKKFIQVKGFNFEYCANPIQNAAVNFQSCTKCLAEDCRVTNTAMVGLGMQGDSCIVRRCIMNSNGQQGFTSHKSSKLRVEDSETSFNNLIAWKKVRVQFQAGGFKISANYKATFLRHQAHGNNGPGMWFDISNTESECSNCFCSGNKKLGGIMNEISMSIYIHDCVLANNEGSGILIAESPDAVLERNICYNNPYGIVFRDAARSAKEVTVSDEYVVLGSYIPYYNKNEKAVKNILYQNKLAQIKLDLNENRQIPRAIMPNPRVYTEYDALNHVLQPNDLSLEDLNFSMDSNYFTNSNSSYLYRWGNSYDAHTTKYNTLPEVQDVAGFEMNGVVADPLFTNPDLLDFTLPPDGIHSISRAYPVGKVPGVLLSQQTTQLPDDDEDDEVVTELDQVKNPDLVYPTYSNDKVRLQLAQPGTGKVTVYSLNGIIIGSFPVLDNCEISTANWPSGLYILRIDALNSTQSMKLIKN